MEILLLTSVYALSCNFIFFLAFFENCGIFSLKIQWKRVKNATCFSFSLWKLQFLMSRCSLPDDRGWVALPALGRAQELLWPRLLQFGILLRSLSSPWSCRGIGMVLEAKPSPPLSQALILGKSRNFLGKSCSGPEQGVCIPHAASGGQGTPVWALVPQPGVHGVQRCCCFRNELLFVSVDTAKWMECGSTMTPAEMGEH